MSKYKKIAKQLLEKINSGSYPDLKIPTEDELMEQYVASRNTIRNAIQLLVELGKIYRVQGSGVYVREMKNGKVVNTNVIRGIADVFSNHKTETKLLDFQVIEAGKEIADKLKTTVGTPVYYLKRLRLVDDRPITLEYSYYNKNIIPYLGKEIAEKSIYQYIENDLKLKIGFADKYIKAEKLTKEDAELFGFDQGDPTLVVNEKVYLSNGDLFNSSRVLHNYELAELFSAAQN